MPDEILANFNGIFSTEDIEKAVVDCFPYENFFKGQKEAIIGVVDALMNKRVHHVILEAPTGVGKTVIAATVHRSIVRLLNGLRFRTTVTTTTKGLQAQYERETNTYDLKGKTNYQCPIGHEHFSTMGCKKAISQKECSPGKMCPYVKRRITWTDASDWRCTNSAMFVEMCPMLCMAPENQADLVIIDECHKFPDTLKDHTSLSFITENLQPLNLLTGGIHPAYTLLDEISKHLYVFLKGKIGKLISFPEELIGKVLELNEYVEAFLNQINDRLKTNSIPERFIETCWRIITNMQGLSDVCEILTDCGVRDFIVQKLETEHSEIVLQPVNVADVSEYGAFRKADYFVHMSATICGLDAYAKQIGIEKDDYVKISMKHPIDVERRIVNYLPVVKMSGGFPDENRLMKMVRAIDELADEHKGDNGLIHTASYKLAEALMARSKHRSRMFVGRERAQTMKSLEMSKDSGGVICLSPSMEEGYDLKGRLGVWQVVAKVPFGFLGDPAVKYICDKLPGQYIRDTVLRVVQSAGRVTRGTDDFGVTYILDESFDRVLSQGEEYIPAWFLDAVRGY